MSIIDSIRKTRKDMAKDVRSIRRTLITAGMPRKKMNQSMRHYIESCQTPPKPTIPDLRKKAIGIIRECAEALRHPDAFGCPNVCGADDAWFERQEEWLKYGKQLLGEVKAWERNSK